MIIKKIVSVFTLTGILTLPFLYKDTKYALAYTKEDNQDLNPTDLSFSSIRNGFNIILRGSESVLGMVSSQTAGIFTNITCTIKEALGGTCDTLPSPSTTTPTAKKEETTIPETPIFIREENTTPTESINTPSQGIQTFSNGLTRLELLSMFSNFKQEILNLPKQVIVEKTNSSSSDINRINYIISRNVENTLDAVSDTATGGTINFSGESLTVSGNVTADAFVGDGSQLTGISAGPTDTDGLVEGSTNLYFTDARVVSAITAGTNLAWSGNTLNSTAAASPFSATGTNNIISSISANTTNTGQNNFFAGYNSGLSNTGGSNNIFMGYSSGLANTTGSYNTFLGCYAGRFMTTGSCNFFVGANSGICNNGCENVFLGTGSGCYSKCGNNNFFVGFKSGSKNCGSNNIFLGCYSGANNTTGGSNTFSGYNSGLANTTGSNNTFFGFKAGVCNTTGGSNTFSGYQSGYCNLSGNENIFSGSYSGYNNCLGSYNIFFGTGSGFSNRSGSCNVFIGYRSAYVNTGSNNIFFGTKSGYSNTTGSYNIVLGAYVNNASTTSSGQLNIGNVLYGTGLYTTESLSSTPVVGGKIGIGTTTPSHTLTVAGCINYTGTLYNNGVVVSASPFSATGTNNIISSISANTTNTGTDNIFAGFTSGYVNTTGSNNIFLGRRVGKCNTCGSCNTFSGYQSGYCNLSGNENIFSGSYSGYNNCLGSYNIFFGTGSGFSNRSGSCNVFIGYRSAYVNTGSNNIFFGTKSGYSNTTGSYNIVLGAYVNNASTTSSGQLNIGNVLYGTGLYTTASPSSAPVAGGKIGIGTTTPGYLLTLCGGAYSDGTAWTNASSYNVKENFIDLDKQEILNKISQLNIQQWNYKIEDFNKKHIGPVAEQFYDLFGLGGTNKSISTIDPAGVALIGIQAIHDQIKDFGKYIQVATDGIIANVKELTVNRLKINGEVCVDDICVTKEQFKQMLQNSGGNQIIIPEPTIDDNILVDDTVKEDSIPEVVPVVEEKIETEVVSEPDVVEESVIETSSQEPVQTLSDSL